MNFEQALKWMYEGKKVRSKKWCDKDINIRIEADEIVGSWDDRAVVTLYMLQADDWEIYEEPKEPKYFDIGEAIRRMKSGKKVSLKFWNNPDIYLSYSEEGGAQLPEIRVKTIRGFFAPWMPNHTELLSEEFYEVE